MSLFVSQTRKIRQEIKFPTILGKLETVFLTFRNEFFTRLHACFCACVCARMWRVDTNRNFREKMFLSALRLHSKDNHCNFYDKLYYFILFISISYDSPFRWIIKRSTINGATTLFKCRGILQKSTSMSLPGSFDISINIQFYKYLCNYH